MTEVDPHLRRLIIAGLVFAVVGNVAAVPLNWPASIGNAFTALVVAGVLYWFVFRVNR